MNILLTSVGRRSYMVDYFQEALGSSGKVHVCNNSFSVAMEKADRWVISPDIFDEAYTDFLLEYCLSEDIELIIPLFDIDLPILAKIKDKFSQKGITVWVSSEDVVCVCNDKYRSSLFLTKNGFSTPQTYISKEDAVHALHNGTLAFPLILKPRWGMGSIAIHQVENVDELYILYQNISRNIFHTYLKYESKIDAKRCVLIQEKAAGDEYGLDIINDPKGNFVCAIPKKKLAMRAGETDCACITMDSRLIELSKKLSEKLKHIGNLDVDCFVNGNKISILEMNCRFGGQYPFSHEAGINLPKQIIDWQLNLPTKAKRFIAENGFKLAKDIRLVKLQKDN